MNTAVRSEVVPPAAEPTGGAKNKKKTNDPTRTKQVCKSPGSLQVYTYQDEQIILRSNVFHTYNT